MMPSKLYLSCLTFIWEADAVSVNAVFVVLAVGACVNSGLAGGSGVVGVAVAGGREMVRGGFCWEG